VGDVKTAIEFKVLGRPILRLGWLLGCRDSICRILHGQRHHGYDPSIALEHGNAACLCWCVFFALL